MESVVTSQTISEAELDAAEQWLDAHPGVLDEFVGEWVAIAGDQIVAHGESMVNVTSEAQRQGFENPLLVPVMPYPFIGR